MLLQTEQQIASQTSRSQQKPALRQHQTNTNTNTGGAPTSFEQALLSTGVLDDRPAVPSGDSGMSEYMVQPFQILSWYPRAVLYPNFMDKAKCDHVIALAEKRLAPSGLALKKGDTLEATSYVLLLNTVLD